VHALHNNCKPFYEVDLHCHSTRSDGNDASEELVIKAADSGMRAIAIVDHDICPENPDKLKKTACKKELGLVFGYEFSCDSNVDDVHIIGYELDWSAPSVIFAQEFAKKSKSSAYKELCMLLTERGLEIDYEKEILNFRDSKGNLQKRTPDEVQRKHIFELLAARGYFPSWEKAKLFVRDDPGLNVKRRKINPLRAIEIIKKCGGLAVLAHPYLIDESLASQDIKAGSRTDYIEKLIVSGLDGIESCYTYSKTTYKGSLTNAQIQKEVEDRYKGRISFFTGGSDYHNDAKKGAANPREIGEAGISYGQFREIFEGYLS